MPMSCLPRPNSRTISVAAGTNEQMDGTASVPLQVLFVLVLVLVPILVLVLKPRCWYCTPDALQAWSSLRAKRLSFCDRKCRCT